MLRAAFLTFSSEAITTVKIPSLSERSKAYPEKVQLEQKADFVNFIAGYLKDSTPSGEHVNNKVMRVDFNSLSPAQLKEHAESINNSPGFVTVLCVALKHSDGYIKRFVFCNGSRAIPQAIQDKAESLGYHVVVAEQAHAEGEFIQFLAKRARAKESYTHVVAMECDKEHCPECHALLRLVFGNDYTQVSASAPRKNYAKKYCIPDNLKAIVENLTKHTITLVGDRYRGVAVRPRHPLSEEKKQIQRAACERLRSNEYWKPFEGDIDRRRNRRNQQ